MFANYIILTWSNTVEFFYLTSHFELGHLITSIMDLSTLWTNPGSNIQNIWVQNFEIFLFITACSYLYWHMPFYIINTVKPNCHAIHPIFISCTRRVTQQAKTCLDFGSEIVLSIRVNLGFWIRNFGDVGQTLFIIALQSIIWTGVHFTVVYPV